MIPFRLSPEARRDIQQLWTYIARDSVEAAARVRREIRDACRRLAQHPYSGHQRGDLTTRQDVLFWPVYRAMLCRKTCASALLHFAGKFAHGLLRNVAAFTTS
jgi:antitoxin ParD1/3/4/toxin ParE1/3/4